MRHLRNSSTYYGYVPLVAFFVWAFTYGSGSLRGIEALIGTILLLAVFQLWTYHLIAPALAAPRLRSDKIYLALIAVVTIGTLTLPLVPGLELQWAAPVPLIAYLMYVASFTRIFVRLTRRKHSYTYSLIVFGSVYILPFGAVWLESKYNRDVAL